MGIINAFTCTIIITSVPHRFFPAPRHASWKPRESGGQRKIKSKHSLQRRRGEIITTWMGSAPIRLCLVGSLASPMSSRAHRARMGGAGWKWVFSQHGLYGMPDTCTLIGYVFCAGATLCGSALFSLSSHQLTFSRFKVRSKFH